ncbi:class I SAM-dependent methyltransferase [Bradyrhizobium acaciae]|uniref:class I SAM-dependent methyltransferase n=1 Tax=Bradyrhizobium acaciae TaxID=2683706 RepID=UPI001E63C490|nr:class I SAM-dependent methyltransferase [Bradyrhizobium acaciae]MCC8980658.1 class I SAM-dependent methyltransferase [Bradyrhizobium acaciae]
MTEDRWRERLEAFFELRASSIDEKPTLDDLCYIAGRNPRLWADGRLLDDLRQDMLGLMNVDGAASVLEVGCAAGFLANVVAPSVNEYVGVDLAEAPLAVARRLQLKNASFERASGERLHFSDQQFDAAFCYDVFSNFPSFAAGEPIIAEMLRVVKPHGRVLIGSIPDRERAEELQVIARNLTTKFEQEFGPEAERAPLGTIRKYEQRSGAAAKIASLLGLSKLSAPIPVEIKPEIVSYYFDRKDFIALGRRLGVETRIVDIHPLNPYFGTRFNAVFESR